MANTGYARTSFFPQRYRGHLVERHATGDDWEVMEVWSATPPTTQPWHIAVYCTADVDRGAAGQLRLRSSAAVSASVAAGTGSWVVDSAGVIRDPAGVELRTAGMNGGAPLALNTFGDPTGYYRWYGEGLPNFSDVVDIWPGHPNGSPEQYPGGLVSPGRYFSQQAGNWVQLEDKVWAMTGQVSPAAQAFGITTPRPDHWHTRLYRMACHLVNGPETWSGAPVVTAATSVPQYVARVQELVALGLIVVPEDHDMTGTNPQLPANLVATPTLASTSVPAGPIRDMLDFYDALCVAFPGGASNVWLGLPNEAFTTGPQDPNYVDFVVTMMRRIRAKNFGGIVTIPLGHWCGDLAGLARGDYAPLITALQNAGVAWSVKFEWHNYGLRYTTAGSTANVPYTWATMDADLAACQQAGLLPWMSEYGQAIPAGTGAAGTQDRNAVNLVATHATPLALKYNLLPTWWSLADGTFVTGNGFFSLTLGPGQTETTATDRRFPWWDIDGTNLHQLSEGGLAHWNLAHLASAPVAADDVFYGISPAVTVSAFARNVRLGFEGVPQGPQLIYVEGRRFSGQGGVRLISSAATGLSAPPPALVTGSLPTSGGGGGGGSTIAPVYAWEDKAAYIEPNPAGAAGSPGKVLADSLGLLRRVSVSNASELAAAKAAALPGDQIYVAQTITGNGTNRVLDWAASDPSGTPANPIMLTTAPGAWIDGGQAAGGANLDSRGIYIVGSDHVWLYGCNVRRATFLAMFNQCNGTPAKPSRVWYCSFQDSGHSMLTLAGNFDLGGSSSYFDVQFNTFDNSGLGGQEFGEAIYIGYGSTNSPTLQPNHHVTIRANHFTRLTAEAIDLKAGTRDVDVLFNLIENCADHVAPARIGNAANVGFPGAVQFPGQTTPPPGWVANIRIIGNRWKQISSNSTKFPDGLILVGAARGFTVVGNLATEINVGTAGFIVYYLDGNVPTAPGDTGSMEVHNNLLRDGNSLNATYRISNAGASQPALLATMQANSHSSNNVRANSSSAGTGADYTVPETAFAQDGTGYAGSFSAPAVGGPLDVAGANTTAFWTTDYAGRTVTAPVKPGARQ